MDYTLYQGDCLEVLKTLPAESVHTVVTSPPYYGLRSYVDESSGLKQHEIGTEETPEAYVERLVAVFREVWRVLHPSGQLWLNLGDSYNGSGGAGGDYSPGGLKEGQPRYPGRNVGNLKQKDLIGIPWRVAFALQADGWWLRSDIIWHKKAPMPESVTDRPTKAHEYVFLLTKSAKYFYDADAIREPLTEATLERNKTPRGRRQNGGGSWESMTGIPFTTELGNMMPNPAGRNKRTVWTLGPSSFPGAHFATMPPKLVEPCILAGTSEKGCCPECFAPWERVVEVERSGESLPMNGKNGALYLDGTHGNGAAQTWNQLGPNVQRSSFTTGWQPTCTCFGHFENVPFADDPEHTYRKFIADMPVPDPIPCTVLDPFSGAGTTGVVAGRHGRRYIGIDPNPDYIALSDPRIGEEYRHVRGEFRTITDTQTHADLPLFAAD